MKTFSFHLISGQVFNVNYQESEAEAVLSHDFMTKDFYVTSDSIIIRILPGSLVALTVVISTPEVKPEEKKEEIPNEVA